MTKRQDNGDDKNDKPMGLWADAQAKNDFSSFELRWLETKSRVFVNKGCSSDKC